MEKEADGVVKQRMWMENQGIGMENPWIGIKENPSIFISIDLFSDLKNVFVVGNECKIPDAQQVFQTTKKYLLFDNFSID